MTISVDRTVYYLPGHGGQLATGLGQGLIDRGFNVTGRETRGDFRSISFDDQVQTIIEDIKNHFWHEQAHVVCNSFGSYLFLHAQALMPSFVGKVLLLSPIVGEFTNEETRTSFSPPRPTRLRELAEAGQFNAPASCEIHVGEADWQSIPDNVTAFGSLVNAQVTVLEGAGHSLPKAYVAGVLDKWLI
jgi:pimeloyl-ACP methyl ester carboxylesterase